MAGKDLSSTADDIGALDERRFKDLQGLTLSGFGLFKHAAFVFVRLDGDIDANRAWLAWMAEEEVSSGNRSDGRQRAHERVALGLAATGLVRLGLPPDVVERFPQELLEGMHHEARARQLGDVGEHAPERWTLGGPKDRIDAVVLLYASSPDALETLKERHARKLTAAGAHARTEATAPIGDEIREHFGFRDGLSQPFLRGQGDAAKNKSGMPPIAAGEILLGYANEYGHMPRSPRWEEQDLDLGRDGTFLVLRQYEQHVGRFWRWFMDQAGGDRALAEHLAEKAVGRGLDGEPLCPARADGERRAHDNDFDYSDDWTGTACPVASHVRRTNPRGALLADSDTPPVRPKLERALNFALGGAKDPVARSKEIVNRHRIVRRGRAYGPRLDEHAALAGNDDGQPRGLFFACLQASIARGFEFVQRTWVQNPRFAALTDDNDPIIGFADGTGHFTIPDAPFRRRLKGIPSFVTLKGGGYFFVPSLPALRAIAAARPVKHVWWRVPGELLQRIRTPSRDQRV